MTRTGTGTRFHLADGHASTRALADGAGTVTDTYSYDAFGTTLASTGTTPNHHLYTGEQLDPNVGFYYLRARWYAQAAGRFTSTDPAEGNVFDPISLHRYLYANADPVDNRDPSGQWTMIEISIGVGLVAGLIAYIVVLARGGTIREAIFWGVVVGLVVAALTYAILWAVNYVPAAAGGEGAALEANNIVVNMLNRLVEARRLRDIGQIAQANARFDAAVTSAVNAVRSSEVARRYLCPALRLITLGAGRGFSGHVFSQGVTSMGADALRQVINGVCAGH
jgi:RHS repeat-associated protein